MNNLNYETINYVGILTINRPKQRHALSLDLLHEINDILDKIKNGKDIRVLIVTATGGKAFCAGADLKERVLMNSRESEEAVNYINSTINKLANIEIPTISAINGAALGGGLELALATDIRIASQKAILGLTETSLAIIPGAGGTQRLTRLIGEGQAKKMIFSAQPINSSEALRIGLIQEVVKDEDILETALDLAKIISNNGPIAIKLAKEAINCSLDSSLDKGLIIEKNCYQQTLETNDRLEGLKAFKEKRKPEFIGI